MIWTRRQFIRGAAFSAATLAAPGAFAQALATAVTGDELAQLARNQRAHAIQKRLNDEAAAEEDRKAHELRTGDRDRVARGTGGLSPDAAAAFKAALGVTPEAFRRSLLHDPNGTRGRKSLDAYNSIIRRLEKGEIDKAEKLLNSHKGRLKDTGGFAKKDRITHKMEITRLEDIDAEVKKWLAKAYEMDA